MKDLCSSYLQFYKETAKVYWTLLNSTLSNFGYGCRNNIDNCKFTALYDEIEEVSSNQKYVSHTVFNEAYKDFACSVTMKEQIEQEYNKEVMKITPEDPCAKAKKYSVGQKRASKIYAVDSMTAKKQRKKPFKDSDQNLDKALHNPNAKMIIDFQSESAVSRNSSTVNKNDNMKVTTRFFSGKRLMFEKWSLMSFIYELTENFYFLNKKAIEIYNNYNIEIIFPYHILTETDRTCLTN